MTLNDGIVDVSKAGGDSKYIDLKYGNSKKIDRDLMDTNLVQEVSGKVFYQYTGNLYRILWADIKGGCYTATLFKTDVQGYCAEIDRIVVLDIKGILHLSSTVCINLNEALCSKLVWTIVVKASNDIISAYYYFY